MVVLAFLLHHMEYQVSLDPQYLILAYSMIMVCMLGLVHHTVHCPCSHLQALEVLIMAQGPELMAMDMAFKVLLLHGLKD